MPDLSACFDLAPQPMAVLSGSGLVVHANAALERLLGTGPDALSGVSLRNTAGIDLDFEHVVSSLAGGLGVVSAEAEFRGPEGRPGQVRVTFTAAGAGLLIGVFEEVTESNAAAEKLRQLSLAVERSPATVVVTDAAGNIEYVNPRFSEVTGYSWAEVIGGNPRILKSGRMKDPQYRDLWDTITAGKTWHGEFLNKRKDGSVYWESASISPVMAGDGSITHFVAVKEDVTLRKNLEAQVQQIHRMEAIGQLAAGVAHQFNNLLTIITGFGQLILSRMEPGGHGREEMLEILKASERASKLTEQLLAFGRRPLAAPQSIAPSALLSEALVALRRIAGESVAVRTDFQADGSVRMDPVQFEQVFLNLAASAHDAMPDGGTLTISTADAVLDEAGAEPLGLKPGRYMTVSVRDTGVGIAAEALPRVFEPAFAAVPDGSGPGLGLPIAYGIVRQNGGVLTVESEPGQGTHFRVLLPACEPVCEPAASPLKPAGEPAGSETVLLVEDEGGVRHLIKRILERHGYRVLEASDGASAMELAAGCQDPIQLLLTDVVMPRMSGPKLAEGLAAMRAGMKTLFMSGYTDDDKLRDAVAGAEIAFLHKPFTQAELLSKIREVLDPATRTVLVADDEPAVRLTIRHMLESSGYKVLEAADGKQAIAALSQEPVDLLLTDLVMPEKEGLEVIRTVRRTRPGVKIIAISGAFGGEFLRAAELLGAHASLRKPVTLEALRKTVAELFEGGPRA